MSDKCEWCFYCDCNVVCKKDKDGLPICDKCAWVETLKDAARKRPPSERPNVGELVLIDFGEGSIGIGLGHFNGEAVHPNDRWTDFEGWGCGDDDIKGWWPIKHLVEGDNK